MISHNFSGRLSITQIRAANGGRREEQSCDLIMNAEAHIDIHFIGIMVVHGASPWVAAFCSRAG